MDQNEQLPPMTEDSVKTLLKEAGAKVQSRSLRNEHYGAPREFSFEVRGIFDNGLALQVVARQFGYRDPWETTERVNDMVDVALLRDGRFSELPKGYAFFQGRDEEVGVDENALKEIIRTVKSINPKLFELQKLTGDL